MRGLAGVTVAQDTILSCRNVHSGLMASGAAPHGSSSSFLCVMLLLASGELDPLSLSELCFFIVCSEMILFQTTLTRYLGYC